MRARQTGTTNACSQTGQAGEFDELPAAEESAWLARHDCDAAVSRSVSLAELFAIRDGRPLEPDAGARFGFADGA